MMKKYKKVTLCLVLAATMAVMSVFAASAYMQSRQKVLPKASTTHYTEPRWDMSELNTSTHYTDKSKRTWYPLTAFYLPQFLTGVKNTDMRSTYYNTSFNGGKSWNKWRNSHYVNGILTPDNEPIAGYDFYYQFKAYVTNSDAKYNYVPYYSGKFYIDTKSPSIEFTPSSGNSTSSLTVAIQAYDSGDDPNSPYSFSNDNGSGLKYYKCRTSSNGGISWGEWSNKKTAGSSVTFKNPGTYEVEVKAVDNVGNTIDKVAGPYVIQKTTPSHATVSGSYRTNTDVITSVIVTAGSEVNPEHPGTVAFTIPGITSQSKSFVVPAGASEQVWFKWHTPSTAQDLSGTVTITSPGGSQTLTPVFSVNEMDEDTPPDPEAKDRADVYFQYTTAPLLTSQSSASWNYYTAASHQREIDTKDPDTGKTIVTYVTDWIFTNHTYSASLSATLKVTPDIHCPTATQSYGMWTMKSGYGIQENVATSVSTDDSSAVTGVQNCVGYYPEFMYNDNGYSFGGYDRVFEALRSSLNAAFDLKPNKYSEYRSHVHFLPVWWSDNKPYQPTVLCIDCWTPGGMICAQSSDTVNIQGAAYNDWYIKPSK